MRPARAPGRPADAEIVRQSGVMAGAPIIAGTRVRVSDVVRHRNLLGSVAGVKRALPHLTRGQIGVALKYYTENREDIDSEIQEEDALLAEARKRRAST